MIKTFVEKNCTDKTNPSNFIRVCHFFPFLPICKTPRIKMHTIKRGNYIDGDEVVFILDYRHKLQIGDYLILEDIDGVDVIKGKCDKEMFEVNFEEVLPNPVS